MGRGRTDGRWVAFQCRDQARAGGCQWTGVRYCSVRRCPACGGQVVRQVKAVGDMTRRELVAEVERLQGFTIRLAERLFLAAEVLSIRAEKRSKKREAK